MLTFLFVIPLVVMFNVGSLQPPLVRVTARTGVSPLLVSMCVFLFILLSIFAASSGKAMAT